MKDPEKKFGRRRGQSVLEAMIALSILTVGFLGITELLVQSLSISRETASETTATYLAAEGIEVTKNLIDHDVYENLAGLGGGWDACFLLTPGNSENYQLDYLTTTCPPALYDNTKPLMFDPATGMYSYSGPDKTPYFREVRVSMPAGSNGNELVVDSIVTWSVNSLSNQSVQLEDTFYNWHP